MKRRILKSTSNITNLPRADNNRDSAMKNARKKRSMSPSKPDCFTDKPVLPPCRICDDKASGFHYGVNSCEACKGFFRRCLSSKFLYTCIENGNCAITPTCRSCTYCRYQRCLDVGMSKQSIKIGRYTLEKKNRDIDEVNHLLKKSDSSPTATASSVATQVDVAASPGFNLPSPLNINAVSPVSPVVGKIVTPAELNPDDGHLENLTEISDVLPSPPSCSNAGDDTAISSPDNRHGDKSKNVEAEPVSAERTGYPVSCKICQKLGGEAASERSAPLCYSSETREIVERLSEANRLYNLYGRVIQNLPELEQKQLHHYNEQCLKRHMFGELHTLSNAEYQAFYEATGIDLEDRLTTVSEVSKLLEDGARRLIKFAKAIPRFKDLTFNDQASLIKASRFEYFLLGAFYGMNSTLEVGTLPDGRNYSLQEIAGVCDYNFTKSMFQFADKLKKLNLSQNELALLKGICLTFSDRVLLDDPQEVVSIQWTLITCFVEMLRHDHPSNPRLFTRVWDRLIELRSLNELNKKFTETLTMEWPVIKSCPLILEILTMC